MPHLHLAQAKKSWSDKLDRITGERGTHPVDRAAQMAGEPQTNANAQGDSARSPEEVFTAAPARQISNYGKIKGA